MDRPVSVPFSSCSSFLSGNRRLGKCKWANLFKRGQRCGIGDGNISVNKKGNLPVALLFLGRLYLHDLHLLDVEYGIYFFDEFIR